MKASYTALARSILLSSALCVAACVPAPDSTPAPSPGPAAQAPVPSPTPTATSAPAPSVAFDNWIDAPRTPGNWSYAVSSGAPIATYSSPDGTPLFVIVCNKVANRIELVREGDGMKSGPITIRTETVDRALQARGSPDGLALGAGVGIRDPLLDAMAVTRGRFAVETEGKPTLYLPPWAEVTRVIEDCR